MIKVTDTNIILTKEIEKKFVALKMTLHSIKLPSDFVKVSVGHFFCLFVCLFVLLIKTVLLYSTGVLIGFFFFQYFSGNNINILLLETITYKNCVF
jgi:hypothetical protein